MTELGLMGIIALGLVTLGIFLYIKGKLKDKKILNTGKVLGASEARDIIRTEATVAAAKQLEKNEKAIKEAEEQIKTNEEVIARSNEAIARARAVREKVSTDFGD